MRLLEQRLKKNDSIQSKMIPILKLPRFFPRRIGGEKARQFQTWNFFWNELSRSHIVLALVNLTNYY